MTAGETKAALTPTRKRLLEVMQEMNFGRIEGLLIRDGEPVFDPPPLVVRDIKLGGQNGPRPELDVADFTLKQEVIQLFAELDRVGNGTVERLEIKHGLPFLMEELVRS